MEVGRGRMTGGGGGCSCWTGGAEAESRGRVTLKEESSSQGSEVFVARRRTAGLNDQSHSCGALPSYSTRVRVPTGPNLLGATPPHEKPFNPEWSQLAL